MESSRDNSDGAYRSWEGGEESASDPVSKLRLGNEKDKKKGKDSRRDDQTERSPIPNRANTTESTRMNSFCASATH